SYKRQPSSQRVPFFNLLKDSAYFCLLFAPPGTNVGAQIALELQSPARRDTMRLDAYFDGINTRFVRGLSTDRCERNHAWKYYVNPVPEICCGNVGRARSLSRSNKPTSSWQRI